MADIIELAAPRKEFGKRVVRPKTVHLGAVEVPADLLKQATISLAETVAFANIGTKSLTAVQALLLKILEQQMGNGDVV